MSKKEDAIELINCTPHPIYMLDEFENRLFSIPACDEPARVKKTYERLEDQTFKLPDGQVFTVPCVKVTDTPEFTNLPPVREGVAYVVSTFVKAYFPERRDLFTPDQLVRFSGGKGPVKGCRQFAC